MSDNTVDIRSRTEGQRTSYLSTYSSTLPNALIVLIPAPTASKSSRIGDLAIDSSRFTSRAPFKYLFPMKIAMPIDTPAKAIMAGDTRKPAIEIPTSSRSVYMNSARSLTILESSTLKSAVNLFKMRPLGTVSSQRNGAPSTLDVTLSKRTCDALIEAAYAHVYLIVPITINEIDRPT